MSKTYRYQNRNLYVDEDEDFDGVEDTENH